ncbi:MAG: hypothetical protein LBO64_02560 [Desulfovibrio sp.]|jgi:aldehyde:ferredoxin oxidoreductase|nr:hypothetical protein [Desulfovibrio sp.]
MSDRLAQTGRMKKDGTPRKCGGCVVQCRKADAGGEKKNGGKWPGFEKFWRDVGNCGPNAELDNAELIARYSRICDDVGVDALEMGRALVLMQLAGILRSGDALDALSLLEEIGQGTRGGRLLGNGVAAIIAEYPALQTAETESLQQPLHRTKADEASAFNIAAESLGLCFFAAEVVQKNPHALAALMDMLKAVSAPDMPLDELGRRILDTEADFIAFSE